MSDNQTIIIPKTQLERMASIQEVEQKVYGLKLDNDISGKILLKILDIYVLTGKTFLNKRIKINIRGDMAREFIVNLYNDKTKLDWVKISPIQNTDPNVNNKQSMTLKY